MPTTRTGSSRVSIQQPSYPIQVRISIPSAFENDYVSVEGPTDVGGSLSLTIVTRERGIRELYTHTLKADHPIGILFSKSPSIPKIDIDSKGGILITGDIQSPAGGLVDLSSIGGSIETGKGATIFGATLTVTALHDVSLTVEGAKGHWS